jgi:predicted MFS family arabinose efflux permease
MAVTDKKNTETAIVNTPATEDYSSAYKRFVLLMLTIVYAFNFIDRQILVILQEPIKADMGLSDAQLGLLSGFTFAIIYVTAGIPIAYWADRGNRRNIVVLSLTVWSGMTALSGFVQNYTQLLLARVGVGLGEAGGSPPAHSMISDYYPPEHRGKALSFYSSGIYIGILVGFMFGGAIAEAFGWRTAFLVVGIPGVLFAVIVRLTVKEPPRGRWDNTDAKTTQPSIKETIALLKQRPSFWFIAVGCSLTAFVSYGNGNFLPSLLIRNHGMSLTEVGITLALVAGLMGAVGTILGGYLGDRFGAIDKRWYLWIPMIGGCIAFLPYIYVIMSDHTVSAVAVLIPVQILSTLYLGPCIAVSHALVPPTMRALCSAILFFVLNMIGLGLGPFLTGLLSDMLAPAYGVDSLRYAMLCTAQVGLLAIFLLYQGAKRLPADLAKQAGNG